MIKENQEIVENVLWLWTNLIAEELEVKKTENLDQGHPVVSERICAKIIKDTCYLEVINQIILGLKKETAVSYKSYIHTILWGMKNVCLHKNFVSSSPLNILDSFLTIIKHILFEAFSLDTIDIKMLEEIINLLTDMLNTTQFETNHFQEHMIDNLDVKFILEKCLASDNHDLMIKGIIFYGTLLMFEGNEEKLMKATIPDIIDFVDLNIFGESSTLFNEHLAISSKSKLIDLHIKSLWMLSNFVVNQKLESYLTNPLLSKDLYGKII